MKITNTFYTSNRDEWREWLKAHHATDAEIWLIFPLKASGEPRIPYDDAVEEALCFGWIDSTVKKIDPEHLAQRFVPRNPKSNWSELNKARARLLIERGKMTEVGLAALGNALDDGPLEVPPDILTALQANPQAWAHFQLFPESYKRIRIGYIEGARNRPGEFTKRLANFIEKSAKNKMFGTMP